MYNVQKCRCDPLNILCDPQNLKRNLPVGLTCLTFQFKETSVLNRGRHVANQVDVCVLQWITTTTYFNLHSGPWKKISSKNLPDLLIQTKTILCYHYNLILHDRINSSKCFTTFSSNSSLCGPRLGQHGLEETIF